MRFDKPAAFQIQSIAYKSHYENVPFEIPESWCWTTLGELCSIKGGKRLPKGKSFADTITPHIYIRVTDMKDHTVLLSSLKYIDEDVFAEIKNYTISSNDLYLTIAGTIGDVGLVPAELDGANLTENAAKLTDIKCSKQYLMYVLMSSIAQDHFCSRFHQVAQPKLSLETASSTLIPLPPYREQLRIAEELDRWLGVVVSVEDDLSELTNYVRKTKSKILDLAISGKLVPQDPDDEPAIELLKRINPDFEPCDNSHYENLPQGWVKLRLGDVCSFERGITFPSSAKCTIKQPGLIACIRTANVQDNLELDDLWYVGNEYIKGNTEKLIRKNDIIMSSANSRELVGKVSYVQDIPEEMTFGGFVLNIRANEGILPFFLFLMLKTLYLKGYYLTIATQTTNIANLNTKILGDIEVLLPPLTEQERIINSVTDILASIENITVEL